MRVRIMPRLRRPLRRLMEADRRIKARSAQEVTTPSSRKHLRLISSSFCTFQLQHSPRALPLSGSRLRVKIISDKMQGAKESAEQAKLFGAEKTGQPQEHARGLGQAGHDKTGQAGHATADTTQTARDKALEGKDHSGNVLQKGEEKVKETLTNTKDTLTGHKKQ